MLADRVGVLGPEREYPSGVPAPDSAVRREQLTRLAAAGLTVLTNRDAVLPLERAQTVALIGRHAIETATMGGGAASVNAPYHVSIAEGLTAVLGDQVTVTDGVDVRTRPIAALPSFVADPATGEAGVHFTLLDAQGTVLDERHSRNATTLVGFDDDIDGIVATVRIRARLLEGGRLRLGVIGAGRWVVTAAGRTVDFTVALAGTGMGEEIVNPPRATDEFDVVAGDVVEATLTVDPTASSTGAEGHLGTIGLIATHAPRDAAAALREATEAAAPADVAVVVVGLTDEQETESVDKSTLRLPGEQDALVSAVAAVARRTVVVVNAATPVLMPWLDTVDAVLWVGLPGQEGGHAVAAALLGIIEPSGRLVTTFPVADGATPAWSVTPVDGDLPYEEGAFIGHRGYYAERAPAPPFWFGHGLGYSTWDYSEGRADVTDQQVSVTVTLTNTGQRVSREVVQVYLEPAAADQPVRLVGWGAVQVAPGESSVVHVACDRRMWRRWDADSASWGWLPDNGRLLVARGLGDVRATFEL